MFLLATWFSLLLAFEFMKSCQRNILLYTREEANAVGRGGGYSIDIREGGLTILLVCVSYLGAGL